MLKQPESLGLVGLHIPLMENICFQLLCVEMDHHVLEQIINGAISLRYLGLGDCLMNLFLSHWLK